jgi:hypothetical protein
VQKVRLAVYSASATTGFVATPVAAGAWNESSNWTNAPTPGSGGLKSASGISDSWVIVDVTGKVSLGGPVSFALTAVDNKGGQFAHP